MNTSPNVSSLQAVRLLREELKSGLNGCSIAEPEGRIQIADLYKRALVEDILPFWFPNSIDPIHGGFYSCLDRDGSILDTDKSVWAQGRMTWMVLRCHQDLNLDSVYLEYAESGIQFLKNHCFDSDGRMFFHVTQEGMPIRKRRYAYSEAFAAIAFAAHARSTKNDASAQKAHELLNQFLDWNFGAHPKTNPKYTDVRPLTGLAPRMIALITAQELRHQLGPDEHLERTIEQMIKQIIRLFVKPEKKCVMEQVQPDGSISDHLDGRLLNPGHAIEAAWFIMQEGHNKNNDTWIRTGCKMLDWNWDRAWDHENGGLLYFVDMEGKPVQEYWHDMKFWWVHSETIQACVVAQVLTKDPKYAEMHMKVHDWSFKHFTDVDYGEWYGYLNVNGEESNRAKGNLWKSCFHLPRFLLLSSQWLQKGKM